MFNLALYILKFCLECNLYKYKVYFDFQEKKIKPESGSGPPHL
jgi:hypothetical protein